MKVILPGALSFSPFGGLQAQGWLFDAQGVKPTAHDIAKLMLLHIAECYHIDMGAADLTRVAPDVERATLDAIAVMRWPARDE